MSKLSTTLTAIASKLSDRDIQALKSIYDLRCLTSNQIYKLHYDRNLKTNLPVKDTFCKSKISSFLDYGLLEKKSYIFNGDTNHCYFLTSKGVDLIKTQFNFQPNINKFSKITTSKGHLRASELKINDKLIPHQIHLNQFYIDFTKLKCDLNYSYKDGKHSSYFSNIMPDGVLTAKDTYFFIETDLGTESRKQLSDKWKHYRKFLQSDEFFFLERKVVVLFILENVSDLQQRRNLVKLTAYEELVDLLGDNFDIYVDSRENILNCLSNKLLKSSLEQTNLPINNLSETLANIHNVACKPAGYISDKVSHANKFIYLSQLKSTSGLQLFFVDEHFYEPLSTFNKIAYFELTKDLFYNKISHTVNLLIIVDSIENLYKDLSLTNLANLNIFFTTIERLEKHSFEEALFQLDLSGNLYTFNHSLDERIFSHNILGTENLDIYK